MISTKEQFCLEWKDLCFRVNEKKDGKESVKTIINNVSGCAYPGEVLAFMGPSGAGKSSLLNMLANQVKQTSGSVLVNGNERTQGFKHIASYVRQEDSLISTLTVEETIRYAARLKLSHTLSREEIDKRVQETISLLGLERVAATQIGNVVFRGVSGGEKRRVSIACELVTDPPIIFLDEPTSGLDSESSLQVMKNLKELARSRNKTIIATIHQPSSETYGYFDRICLLTLGRVAFWGTGADALTFYDQIGYPVPSNYNPPDYFLRVLNTDFSESADHIDKIVKTFNESEFASQPNKCLAVEEGNKREHANPVWYQVAVLTERAYLNAMRHVLLYWVRVAMYICMALLMGTTWLDLGTGQDEVQDRFSVHFFAGAFLCFMSVAGIPAIIEDKQVFDREKSNGSYSVLAYVLSNTFVSLPFIFLIALCFTSIAYPLIGLHSGADHFFKFLWVLFLALYTIESIVVTLSAAIPIFVVSLALSSFLNGFFFVVQGYFVRLSTLPDFWDWAHFWSYQTYCFEALVYNDFKGLIFSCSTNPEDIAILGGSASCFCSFPSDLNTQCQFRGEDVLREYGYENTDYWLWASILVIQIVCYRALFYVCLRWGQKLFKF